MSRKIERVDLVPPAVIGKPGKSLTEVFVGDARKCPYCNGNGVKDTFHEDCHEWRLDTCPLCGGDGELQPVVTVEWKRKRSRV